MREYSTIRDAIKSLGATVAEEHLQPEFFGSAYCVFNANQNSQFRLVWDGKEGYGFLQSATSPEHWQDISPHVSGVSNPQAPKFVELVFPDFCRHLIMSKKNWSKSYENSPLYVGIQS